MSVYTYIHTTHIYAYIYSTYTYSCFCCIMHYEYTLLFESGVYHGGRGRSYNTAFTHPLWGNAWSSSKRWLKDNLMLVNNHCKED